MKILGLCSFPVESAATRHRLMLYQDHLRANGVELDIVPFLDSEGFVSLYSGSGMLSKSLSMVRPVLNRIALSARIKDYDAVIVQREAMFFGPELFERLYQMIGQKSLILDLDDATYIRYNSPTFGRIGSALKFFGKTNRLIRRADIVICGNRFIAEHVANLGGNPVVLPTIVDPDVFRPSTLRRNPKPVLGWIGTHSTYPLLESIFPVIRELAKGHDFKLRVVGSGRSEVFIDGVDVENVSWNLEREPSDFADLDIGLYPLALSDSASAEWLMGKSGFKAVQYLATGVPFVMTPIGVCAEIGVAGETHFAASSTEEWLHGLKSLLDDPALRLSMGEAGRRHFEAEFSLAEQAEKMLNLLESAKR